MKLLTITTTVLPTLLAMMSIGIDGVHSYDYDSSSSGGRLRGAVGSGGYDDEVGDWDWDNTDDVGVGDYLESDNFLEVGSLQFCTFPFPNCPNRFNCVNRLNARPVCHRRGDCLPRGYRAPSTGRFQFAACCSNRGSGNHCL